MVSSTVASLVAGAISSMAPSLAGVPTITSEAARAAAGDLKRQKNSSGRAYATSRADEQRLSRRSRKLAKDFQDKMEKTVKRKLDNMSGSQDNRKVGLKVAQFIPGKGLEVAGAQVDNDPAIYCSLGLKGDKLVDPLDETFMTVKGRKVSMDFAFKLVNPNNDLLKQEKDTRITTLNCFRHVNPDSFNYYKTGWTADVNDGSGVDIALATANANWHKTLGPDATPIRRATGGLTALHTQAGTWRGLDNGVSYPEPVSHVGGLAEVLAGSVGVPNSGDADKANSLMSPYRYPFDMEVMYSRLNRQLLENYGWMLNPYKFSTFQHNSSRTDLATTPPISTASLQVYANPGPAFLDFTTLNTSAVEQAKSASFPARINRQIGASFGPGAPFSDHNGFEWHSQFGSGKLNYQFCNDGTNPVCIDICVIGIKKNSPIPVETLQNICDYNYKIHKFANLSGTNLNGYQTSTSTASVDFSIGDEEWHKNAKMPFFPDECFKNPQSYLAANPPEGTSGAAQDTYQQLLQGKNNPFKVVKRDQFIVSSGSSRAWNTTLPSIKYRPQVYDDVEYPISTANVPTNIAPTADEYTFVLAIGASGLPRPVEEVYPSVKNLALSGAVNNQMVDAKAIIDRQPTTVNVSVCGTYTETVQPCFPKDTSSVNFINGRLTEPYFTEAPGKMSSIENANKVNPSRVNTVDIAQMGQIVHTSDTGIVGVGAITTEIGA